MYYKKNEVTLFYNQNRELDRKTLAMALGLNKKINRQELNSVRVSETLFYLLVDRLGGDPKILIDKSHPYYQDELKGMDFSSHDWYAIIMHHPDLLKAPIALFHDKAIMCNTPANVLYCN